ncbi:hypothetical protein NDU88_001022 [Pleurodeles waltl]|uniref:Uncharacterized protein n=1 Tax=Pleurodeles waltl TaxID=8319 RepID=A0AAV7VV87_PLEWA|nr:hypothetical protein NDU88_001022 [Pleurodeles waltl]
MGARPKGARAQLHMRVQARSPLERGVELVLKDAEERPLAGAFKMAAPMFFSWSMPASEKNRVSKPVMALAPGSQVSKEIVIISDEEEDVHEGTGSVADLDSRGDLSAIWADGRDQSLPVKVRAPSEHRHEGRVRSGEVHPTSREIDGPNEAQPSTSQGAGAGWAYLDEELLDYEEELEVPVTSKKRVVVAGEVPGVVQGCHVPAHRQEVSAGNLPRGEEGFVGSLRLHEGRDSFGDSSRAKVSKVIGGSREIRNTVDASIQVSAVTEVEGKSEVIGVLVMGHYKRLNQVRVVRR